MKLKQKLVINTHGNKILDTMVRGALKEACNIEFLDSVQRIPERHPFIYVDPLWPNLMQSSRDCDWDGIYSNTKIDAATGMLALAQYLTEPENVIIKHLANQRTLVGTSFTDGVIDLDGSKVTVGCSDVTFAKVEETYLAMCHLKKVFPKNAGQLNLR